MLPGNHSIQAIVLAAGRSQRFNGTKQLARVGDQTMVDLVLASYLLIKPAISGVTLVLGANADLIENHVSTRFKTSIGIFQARDWQQGIGRSLGQAIAILEGNVSHVLIGLADQVAVTSECLGNLVEASLQSPDKIVAARYQSTQGAPVIFPRSYFRQLSMLSGDRGAKSLLHEYQENLILVDMPNAAVDIDTREDLERWIVGTGSIANH